MSHAKKIVILYILTGSDKVSSHTAENVSNLNTLNFQSLCCKDGQTLNCVLQLEFGDLSCTDQKSSSHVWDMLCNNKQHVPGAIRFSQQIQDCILIKYLSNALSFHNIAYEMRNHHNAQFDLSVNFVSYNPDRPFLVDFYKSKKE